MPSTILPPTESAGAPADAEPRWRSRLRRRPMLVGAAAGIAALALLIAGWVAVPAGAQDGSPDPDGAAADVSYEQCVEAALAALGPVEEASDDGMVPDDWTGDPVDPVKGPDDWTGDPPDDEEVHPNSPAHEMCTEDCSEDEQCPRPTEFIVVRDENVGNPISFENPEPEGDPAA